MDPDLGRASHAVATDALEHEKVAAPLDRHRRGRRRDLAVPADREHVAERRLERELDRDTRGSWVRVQHADPLAQAVGEEARAAYRHRRGAVAARGEGA